MIVAVDFDGTLHDGEWPSIGKPREGAVEAMRQLKDDGHHLIIWTCREGLANYEMVWWLRRNGIPFDDVNVNEPSHVAEYGNDCRKVYADVYVDDKQVGGLPSWRKIYRYINWLHRKEIRAVHSRIELTDGFINI
jgi:hypothetical protein